MDITQFCPECIYRVRWAAAWKKSAKDWRHSRLIVGRAVERLIEILDVRNKKIARISKICREELDIIDREGGVCRGYKRILAVLDANE